MDGICTHDAFTASITQQSLGHESENESGSKKKKCTKRIKINLSHVQILCDTNYNQITKTQAWEEKD